MPTPRVIIIGSGMGGLAAAVDLVSRGLDVTVLERAAAPGGKARQVQVGDVGVDAGPTVFTMRYVFEALFADAGERLEDHLDLTRAELLARHAWTDGSRLDLHANVERSAAAIEAFAGQREADGYRRFCADARRTFEVLDAPFIRGSRPSALGLTRRIGLHRIGDLLATRPLRTLWGTLGDYFHDPRLRQLFARYATYVGSSPFAAPATLMLIAHVEQTGVWLPADGMHGVARALAALAEGRGARFHYDCEAARIENRGAIRRVVATDERAFEADAVIVNADASALATGLLGEAVRRAVDAVPPRRRSLSALTWTMRAQIRGWAPAYHTVCFGPDYPGEFRTILGEHALPRRPTVYLCAQDRAGGDGGMGSERVLCLINAPAVGDLRDFDDGELRRAWDHTQEILERCGLTLTPEQTSTTSPSDFARLFPGSGGAIYGRATHGMLASFRRPGSRTRMPGLYLAGGSAHPGAGVPMAILSGRQAAASVLMDLASIG